jgi:phosphomecalonate degydratase large subunit
MRLTKAQHHLREQGSEAQRQAMRILLALAKISDADRLIPITGAHVSGASYKMIGDPGLEFLEDAARDARVVVPTTVNPLGTDLRQWRDLAIPPEFAAKQERIAAAYERMGVHPIYSCTPYHVGTRPVFGEHVAWAESNAVCFANSVLGARTNRESGPSALAAAIVGATPEYGLHLDEGRRPTLVVTADVRPRDLDFSLLGLVAGERVGDGLPFFRGFRGSEGDLKWLGAALASSGSCGMFHLEGVTPEARRVHRRGLPSISITRRDLSDARRHYTDGADADLIALGSPQLSTEELRDISRRVERSPPRIPVWVFTSRAVRDANPEAVAAIERLGGRVLADTCLEVTLLEHRFGTVATPSGKGAYYLPTLGKQKVILDRIDVLLERYA